MVARVYDHATTDGAHAATTALCFRAAARWVDAGYLRMARHRSAPVPPKTAPRAISPAERDRILADMQLGMSALETVSHWVYGRPIDLGTVERVRRYA